MGCSWRQHPQAKCHYTRVGMTAKHCGKSWHMQSTSYLGTETVPWLCCRLPYLSKPVCKVAFITGSAAMSNPKNHSTCLQHTVIWKNIDVTCNRHQAWRSSGFKQLSFLSEEVWCHGWVPEGQQHWSVGQSRASWLLTPAWKGALSHSHKAGESRLCFSFNTDSLCNLEQDPTPHLPRVEVAQFIHFPVLVCLLQPVPMGYFQVTGSRVPGKNRAWLC